MVEEWREYRTNNRKLLVSNHANIQIKNFDGTWTTPRQYPTTYGGLVIQFWEYIGRPGSGRRNTRRKVRLRVKSAVWETWGDADGTPAKKIKHLDGDLTNCRPENLYVEGEVMCFKCGNNPGDLSNFGLCEECAND